jgi:hypothetical protein
MSEVSRSLYRGHRFPAEIISQAVWLYFRFPLSLRMVEDLLAARGIVVSHETVRRWAEKFGRDFANTIRRSTPQLGNRWHLDEVVVTIHGKSIGFGVPLIRTPSCSTLWFKAAVTGGLPNAYCASLSVNRPAPRGC